MKDIYFILFFHHHKRKNININMFSFYIFNAIKYSMKIICIYIYLYIFLLQNKCIIILYFTQAHCSHIVYTQASIIKILNGM